eukprot:TRINITY_DN72141_c0_g1_i1.p1 TRINITY_DN72141_c0_g1~~TRINITY_DN72141_c0_g1_i1.p1  ORF type:complete len:1264 (+),score=275.21 TRINITY_DN72141_c0_g1_i1:490-3792(+)
MPTYNRQLLGEGPIAAVLVVDFHHLQGPVVEWAHPPLASPTQASSAAPLMTCPSFPAVNVWAEPDELGDVLPRIAQVTHMVPFLALPDGSHGERSDETSSVFFILPFDGGLLYCVSCHRRVGASDLLHKDESVSRSWVQKAVVVMSRCPFFGLIQQRLSPVTHALFEQRDFRSTSLLSDFHLQLNSLEFEKLSESELFYGLEHAALFRALRPHLLSVLKAILSEAKVLVHSNSAEACSRAVLSLLALLPGGLWLSFNSDGLGNRHFHCSRYGYPFRCFGSHCGLYPYASLQLFDKLLKMKGFLIGVTNKMMVERLAPDIVLNVPASALELGSAGEGVTIDYNNKELQRLVKATPADKKWCVEALQPLEAAAPAQRHTNGDAQPSTEDRPLFASSSPDASPVVANGRARAHGGDAAEQAQQLAKNAKKAAKALFAESAAYASVWQSRFERGELFNKREQPSEEEPPPALLQEAAWSAVIDASRFGFWKYFDRLVARVAFVAGAQRNFAAGLEEASKDAKDEAAHFGIDFLTHWTMETQSGRAFLKQHRLPVSDWKLKPPRNGYGTYSFANGDEYHGEFRRGRRHGQGIYKSSKKRMSYDGEWYEDKRSGSGTLIVDAANGQVFYTYDGEWRGDARHGQGSCVCRGKEKYSGQWANNAFHGAGTYVDQAGTMYEGEWATGNYHGAGKYTSKEEAYKGEFCEGERHGHGQLVQAEDSSAATPDEDNLGALGREKMFAGQWRRGRRHGHGQAMYEAGEFDGDFADNLRHGHGELSSEGYRLEGAWAHGEPQETGTHLLFFPDGRKYTGGLRCNVRFGPPPTTTPAASPRDDEPLTAPSERLAAFAASLPAADELGPGGGSSDPSSETCSEACLWWVQPQGQGLMKYPDGRLYDGEHNNGLPHGVGMAIATDRSKYEGQFQRGARHGDGHLALPASGEATRLLPPQAVRYVQGKLLEQAMPDNCHDDRKAAPRDAAAAVPIATGYPTRAAAEAAAVAPPPLADAEVAAPLLRSPTATGEDSREEPELKQPAAPGACAEAPADRDDDLLINETPQQGSQEAEGGQAAADVSMVSMNTSMMSSLDSDGFDELWDSFLGDQAGAGPET